MDFEFAHIVPRGCLDVIGDRKYHMCLAHLVYEERLDWSGSGDHRYTEFYRRMSEEGKFVIMDNGAAENSQLCEEDLVAMYNLVKPTEIVIPDTICDMASTLKKADAFISKYSDLPYQFMGVPQGNDLDEWLNCAFSMVQNNRINAIGISKFLNIVTKNPNVRYDAAQSLWNMAKALGRDDIKIHLLGCDEGPGIVRNIHLMVPIVRGCDSAFAYLAAQNGTHIGKDTTRPKGKIDFLDGGKPSGLVDRLYEMEEAAYTARYLEKQRERNQKNRTGRYYVSKRMEIAGSHYLSLPYPSKCENLHGHNWVVTVHCTSNKLTEYGMVVDFTKVKEAIHGQLDHTCLNDTFNFNPTAENMAEWICNEVTKVCPNGGYCYKVEVQESEGNIATYVLEENV